MSRIARAASVAAIGALLLTGCALWESGERAVTDVYNAVIARQVLNDLTDELRQSDDVVSVDSTVTAVEMKASVTVALHPTAPPDALAAVATRVADVLSSEQLQPFENQFSVERGDSGIRQVWSGATSIDFAAEVAHWKAVQATIGADLTLELSADDAEGKVRILSATADATVAAILENYDRVVALTAPGSADTLWRLPGIMVNTENAGPLPERNILNLLAEMATVTNLLDASVVEEPPGLFAVLPSGSPPSFTFVANAPGDDIDSEEVDHITLQLTQQASATGLAQYQISVHTYSAGGVDTAAFHVGECEQENPPTSADQRLVDTLVAAGVPLSVGAAGVCLVFAPAS